MGKKGLVLICILSFILGIIGGFFHPLLAFGAFFIALAIIVLTTDFTVSLYILSGYLIIDYALRSVPETALLASVWDEVFLLGCVLLLFVKWFREKTRTSPALTPVHVTLMLFICVNIFLLLVNSTYPEVGLEGVRAVIQHMLWFFIVYAIVRSKTDIRRVLFFMNVACLLIAIYGIFQYVVGVEMPAQWADMAEGDIRTRAFSILGNPNALGSVMALASMLSLSLLFTSRNLLQRLYYLASFSAMALCLVVTLSRGAWIGFAVSLILFVLLVDKRYFLPLLVLGVLVMLFIPAISDRMIYMLSPQYIYSSLMAGRLYRWELGWEMFRNNLFLGVGPGHFGGAVSMRYTYYFEDVFYMDNYYLKTAVELGLAGLVSFLVLLYSLLSGILKGLLKMKRSEEKTILSGIFTGMAGVLIHGFFENVFEVPGLTVLFWICAGLAMALIYKPDSQALHNIS